MGPERGFALSISPALAKPKTRLRRRDSEGGNGLGSGLSQQMTRQSSRIYLCLSLRCLHAIVH